MSNLGQGSGDELKQRLRAALHEVVAARVSAILLRRLEAVLDGAESSTLPRAANKMSSMVALFVGSDEAKVLTERFGQILTTD